LVKKQSRKGNSKSDAEAKAFLMYPDQIKKFKKWDKKHEKCAKEDTTAIGGRLTYRFTPTGLGDILVVKCNQCGEELDLTESDKW